MVSNLQPPYPEQSGIATLHFMFSNVDHIAMRKEVSTRATAKLLFGFHGPGADGSTRLFSSSSTAETGSLGHDQRLNRFPCSLK